MVQAPGVGAEHQGSGRAGLGSGGRAGLGSGGRAGLGGGVVSCRWNELIK